MTRNAPANPARSAEARREMLRSAFRGELRWSDAIKRMRLSLGMSQEGFGRMFGISRRRIVELETGKANPTVETLVRIGKPFGLVPGFVPREDMQPLTQIIPEEARERPHFPGSAVK